MAQIRDRKGLSGVSRLLSLAVVESWDAADALADLVVVAELRADRAAVLAGIM